MVWQNKPQILCIDMNHGKKYAPNICKRTGKVSLSSEAKATRKMNLYNEIQRVYFCEYCDGFHLTSETVEQTLANGGVSTEEENRLLRKYNDKLVTKIGKLKKSIGILRDELNLIKNQ